MRVQRVSMSYRHVVAVNGDRVRLGIEAPKDIPVMREELLQDQSEAPVT
jgi:carbon storage regulator CsrA